MTEILGYVTALAEKLFSVGTSLVNFITSNPICLIGVGLFILVAMVGAIRRLIPGV